MSKQNATKLVWAAVIAAACVVAVPLGWVAYEPVKGWLFAPEVYSTRRARPPASGDELPVAAPPVESD